MAKTKREPSPNPTSSDDTPSSDETKKKPRTKKKVETVTTRKIIPQKQSKPVPAELPPPIILSPVTRIKSSLQAHGFKIRAKAIELLERNEQTLDAESMQYELMLWGKLLHRTIIDERMVTLCNKYQITKRV